MIHRNDSTLNAQSNKDISATQESPMAEQCHTDQQLITRHIISDPRGRAHARLRDTGTHVWPLVGHWQGVDGDVAKVAADYAISDEVIEAALAYSRQHRAY